MINWFTHVARRKLKWPRPQVDAALGVLDVLLGEPHPLTRAMHARALGHAKAHDLPFQDALILAAAEDVGWTLLVSGDFQPGRRFGPVAIENPFRANRPA